LDAALHDQFVCGLNDRKCQRELLTVQGLILKMAIQKAIAGETATRESRRIHGAAVERTLSKDLLKMSVKSTCYRWQVRPSTNTLQIQNFQMPKLPEGWTLGFSVSIQAACRPTQQGPFQG